MILTQSVLILLFQIRLSIGGIACHSCIGVDSPTSCNNVESCNENEVCYMQKYTLGTGTSIFDLGCILPQICQGSGIFGKRSGGRHIQCVQCCSTGRLCNRDLRCSSGDSLPRECADLPSYSTSGIHTIYPSGIPIPVKVYCDMSKGEKWTIVQRRIDGHQSFHKNWTSYKTGFGNVFSEYWLGNDIIHEITSHGNHKLQIDLEYNHKVHRTATYSTFTVGDELRAYELLVSGYDGDAGDALSIDNGLKFSTFDSDNDPDTGSNVANQRGGGWWYSTHCVEALDMCVGPDLNGLYHNGKNVSDGKEIFWETYNGLHPIIRSTTMKFTRFSKTGLK